MPLKIEQQGFDYQRNGSVWSQGVILSAARIPILPFHPHPPHGGRRANVANAPRLRLHPRAMMHGLKGLFSAPM